MIQYKCKICGGLMEQQCLTCMPPIQQNKCMTCGRIVRDKQNITFEVEEI